ncbi:hypothetical protein C8Q75DRAFT_455950 [Abortiporus biennis]|nr:hypothetical protein C8Q75DRAFT_455950 [Abortiporus biennis]
MLQYSKTCRFLRQAAILHVLRDFSIKIYSEQLPSFYQFLKADLPSRCRFLRKVDFSIYDFNFLHEQSNTQQRPTEKVGVFEIISNAKILEELSIRDLTWFLSMEPGRTHSTIASLSGLQLLHLGNICHMSDVTQILRELKAPLRDLTLRTRSFPEGSKPFPTQLLAPFSSTLERLELNAFDIEFSETVLPQVYELDLHTNLVLSLRLRDLVAIFPSLLFLDIHDPADFYMEFTDTIEIIRSNNKFAHTSSMWALSILSGSVNALYALGLSTTVFYLFVRDITSSSTYNIPTIIEDTNPEHVDLSILYNDNFTTEGMGCLIGEGRYQSIHLDFNIQTFFEPNDAELLEDFFDLFYTMLELVKTPILLVTLNNADDHDGPVYQGLQNLDLYSFALKIAQCNRYVKWVYVSAVDRTPAFFQVYPWLNHDSTLKKLPIELAEDLMEPDTVGHAIRELVALLLADMAKYPTSEVPYLGEWCRCVLRKSISATGE